MPKLTSRQERIKFLQNFCIARYKGASLLTQDDWEEIDMIIEDLIKKKASKKRKGGDT